MVAVAAAEGRARGVSARAAKDAVLVGAVDLARSAAEQVADRAEDVGEHLGTLAEADRLISHRFAASMRGYRGWQWTVTLARVPRGRVATVCEVELLPGDDALLAPQWLPWAQRLQPGDIGPGDVLPFRAEDPRLVPGYVATGDEAEDAVAIGELALARARILSQDGRDEAAERWYRGARGPTTSGAVASGAECLSCGFLVPLQGALGQVFGVCANAWSPDDGKVVSLDHGCGAHSETDVDAPPTDWPAPDPLIDELHVELVSMLRAASEEPDAEPASDADAVPAAAVESSVDPDAAAPVLDAPVEAIASATEPVTPDPVETVSAPAGSAPTTGAEVAQAIAEVTPADAVADPEPAPAAPTRTRRAASRKAGPTAAVAAGTSVKTATRKSPAKATASRTKAGNAEEPASATKPAATGRAGTGKAATAAKKSSTAEAAPKKTTTKAASAKATTAKATTKAAPRKTTTKAGSTTAAATKATTAKAATKAAPKKAATKASTATTATGTSRRRASAAEDDSTA